MKPNEIALHRKLSENPDLLRVTLEFLRYDYPLHPASIHIVERFLGVGRYSGLAEADGKIPRLNQKRYSVCEIKQKALERINYFHLKYCLNNTSDCLNTALFMSLASKLNLIYPHLCLDEITTEVITEIFERVDVNPFEIFRTFYYGRKMRTIQYQDLWRLTIAHAKNTGMCTISPDTEDFVREWSTEAWLLWYRSPSKRPFDIVRVEWWANRLEKLDPNSAPQSLLDTLDQLRDIILIVKLYDA